MTTFIDRQLKDLGGELLDPPFLQNSSGGEEAVWGRQRLGDILSQPTGIEENAFDGGANQMRPLMVQS